jgi:hypothetical protein
MKKLSIYISVGIMICLASCKKDFLNRYPQTGISPQLFFKSEQDLALYVNGLLSLPGTGNYHGDQGTDNAATTSSIEIKNMMIGTPSSKTITGGWSWSRLRDINYFLDHYNNPGIAKEAKDHFAGLARYYRSQFYFDKVKRYSDVPWYSRALLPDDSTDLYLSRSPRALIMDSVMADLGFAASHVREKVPSGTPNIWAVKAFYARVALYEGTYRKYHPELQLQNTADRFLDTARDVAEDIMNSHKFHLYNTGDPYHDYAVLFSGQDLLSNPEIILARPFDASKPGAVNGDQNSYIFGDYEQSPSRDLIQAYLMKDGARLTNVAGYNKLSFVQEFQDRDPRIYQTLAYPGWIRFPDTKPYVQQLNKNFTGYHQLKGYINTTTDGVIRGSVDFPVYRYAEVLLNYAEALAELGQLTQTDLDASINLIRNRAGIPSLSMAWANAHPDPVLMAKFPEVTGANQGVILEIRRGRRVELALEGYRFDDLMRWHAGKVLGKIPEGMYFPGLGKYDMTGDNVPDIILIGENEPIPAADQKEKNSLGETLVYYKAGNYGDNVTVYLRNGENGGTLVTDMAPRQFIEPTYYYRPVPYSQMVLNPNLKQIFGWE